MTCQLLISIIRVDLDLKVNLKMSFLKVDLKVNLVIGTVSRQILFAFFSAVRSSYNLHRLSLSTVPQSHASDFNQWRIAPPTHSRSNTSTRHTYTNT